MTGNERGAEAPSRARSLTFAGLLVKPAAEGGAVESRIDGMVDVFKNLLGIAH